MSEPFKFPYPPSAGDPALAGAFGIEPPPPQDPPMTDYRGYALNQPFDLRTRFRMRDKPVLGYWLGAYPYPNVARHLGQAGFDFVGLDWEHTPMAIDQVCDLIRIIQYAGEGKTACIVRTPSHEHHYVAWLLDAGASAVIFPHVSTVEQAEKAVQSCRFPVHGGARSGPPNALQFGFNDLSGSGGSKFGAIFETFNRAAVIIQIEDKIGADNAEAIAAVEGVDALMCGPGDLALDLGVSTGEMYGNKEWIDSVMQISKAAEKAKIGAFMPGFFAKGVPGILQMGFNIMTVANDGLIMTIAARKELSEAAQHVKDFAGQKQSAGAQ